MIPTRTPFLAAALVACGLAGSNPELRAQGPALPMSDEGALEKLDPAARAQVDEILRGLNLNAPGGSGRVAQRSVQRTITVPGPVTVRKVVADQAGLTQLDPATRARVEAAMKEAGINTQGGNARVMRQTVVVPGRVTVKHVGSDQAALEKLDPATRARVDEALKGVGVHTQGENSKVMRNSKRRTTTVPGPVTVKKIVADQAALESLDPATRGLVDQALSDLTSGEAQERGRR